MASGSETTSRTRMRPPHVRQRLMPCAKTRRGAGPTRCVGVAARNWAKKRGPQQQAQGHRPPRLRLPQLRRDHPRPLPRHGQPSGARLPTPLLLIPMPQSGRSDSYAARRFAGRPECRGSMRCSPSASSEVGAPPTSVSSERRVNRHWGLASPSRRESPRTGRDADLGGRPLPGWQLRRGGTCMAHAILLCSAGIAGFDVRCSLIDSERASVRTHTRVG